MSEINNVFSDDEKQTFDVGLDKIMRSCLDFRRSLRGCNMKSNLDIQYLASVMTSVKTDAKYLLTKLPNNTEGE